MQHRSGCSVSPARSTRSCAVPQHFRESSVNNGALNRNIVQVDTEYGRVLLDEAKSIYWLANPTAALLLDILDRGGDAEEAVRQIVRRLDIDEKTPTRDGAARPSWHSHWCRPGCSLNSRRVASAPCSAGLPRGRGRPAMNRPRLLAIRS
ncbi:PqqD family peptide modification chaperone [Nocardia terpenica]|uniref:PqqD family peptide modification chaperone n=1 Tax=Nocardia terpenica TaxID=455432 RepID=UPI003D161924